MLAPTCRTARRFCVQLDPRSAEPTFIYGTAVWPACRIRSSPDTSQPVPGNYSRRPPRDRWATLREGDRAVFFDVHRTCGRCRACAVHRTPTRCPERRVYGITDPADDGLFGGWSQAIYLEPGVHIARLPDAVCSIRYIGGGCGLLTAVHIIERAGLRAGETLLVQGTGAVGLSTIALGAPQRRLFDYCHRRAGEPARPRATRWAPIACLTGRRRRSRSGANRCEAHARRRSRRGG